jgi:RNA polymerase sigma factor (sigma-70 family)
MIDPLEPSDHDLVRGCRANNRKMQEMLYRRYAKDMYNLCLMYVKDRDEAKDILQDAFIKIFRNLEKYDMKGSLNGWIRRIVVNTAIDQYRKNNSSHQFIPLDNVVNSVSENESAVSNLFAVDLISKVERLPEGARMIFRLYALEGYSHKEISGMLNISEGTSKSQTNRARQLLQKWVEVEKLKN